MTKRVGGSKVRWIVAVCIIGGATTAGAVAWRGGFFATGVWGLLPGRNTARHDEKRSKTAALPVEEVEPELPADIAEAQYEPPLTDAEAEQEPPGDAIDAEPAAPDVLADAEDAAGHASLVPRIIPTGFEVASDDSAVEATGAAVKVARTPADRTGAVSRAPDAVPEPVGEAGLPNDAGKLLGSPEIEALASAGDLMGAQRELSRWYWRKPELRQKLLPRLNELASSIYFAPQPHVYDPYVVQPGDQLRVIAQRYKLSWEYVAQLNRVDARKIRMGQKLKVVQGPFGAVVSLADYQLVIHQGGNFVKSYRVGVGKDGTTPLGTFVVKNKMADPTYYGPDGVIAHDDPQNPLGERWIDIGDGFGIHGTIEPDSIGRNESRGCIRLLNEDAAEVYDLLIVGSEVTIRR